MTLRNRYLVDTNILIDFLKGKTDALDLLIEMTNRNDNIFFSVITRIELMTGMRQNELTNINNMLSYMKEIEVNKEIAIYAGVYMNSYYKSYNICVPDAIIAASAKTNNLTLLTLNIKHFPMSDIQVIKPY